MENRTMYIETKKEYGQTRYYPGCEISEKFAKLIGKKTFNKTELLTISELGFIIAPIQIKIEL